MSCPRCATPDTTLGHCHLCHDDLPTLDLLGHLRAIHPDRYEPIECWPDGEPVIDSSEVAEVADFT